MNGQTIDACVLLDLLEGRLKAIDGNIAAEKLAGNIVKEAAERGARAEIVALQCDICRGRLEPSSPLCVKDEKQEGAGKCT